jgi:hypothetical protein
MYYSRREREREREREQTRQDGTMPEELQHVSGVDAPWTTGDDLELLHNWSSKSSGQVSEIAHHKLEKHAWKWPDARKYSDCTRAPTCPKHMSFNIIYTIF